MVPVNPLMLVSTNENIMAAERAICDLSEAK